MSSTSPSSARKRGRSEDKKKESSPDKLLSADSKNKSSSPGNKKKRGGSPKNQNRQVTLESDLQVIAVACGSNFCACIGIDPNVEEVMDYRTYC